jgi:hypothetical protein
LIQEIGARANSEIMIYQASAVTRRLAKSAKLLPEPDALAVNCLRIGIATMNSKAGAKADIARNLARGNF